MKNILKNLFALTFILAMIHCGGCKKKSDNAEKAFDPTKVVGLSVQTAAQSIHPDESATYSAVFIDSNGNTTPATEASWSVNNGLGNFNGNVFTPKSWGTGRVTAIANMNGKFLTAHACLGVFLPASFSVVPSAIMWTGYSGSVDLQPQYLGPDLARISGYSYSSSAPSIASVDSNGKVTFHSTGTCTIAVQIGLSGQNNIFVPVVVEGAPPAIAPLPVLRVAMNHAGSYMFSGEAINLAATAFNNSNAATSATFGWSSDNVSVATVGTSGLVTAVAPGHAVISATACGISGRAEIEVLADTIIEIVSSTINLPVNWPRYITTQAFKINRATKTADAIETPTDIHWSLPGAGIPTFDIATISSTGWITIKESATPGSTAAVVVRTSSSTTRPGVAKIVVSE